MSVPEGTSDPAMAEPWTTHAEPARLGRAEGAVTLVEGSSFVVSDRLGDFRPEDPQGLFFLDTRLLSRLQLTVDGQRPQALAVVLDEPFAATFVQRAQAESGQPGKLVVLRRRYVGRGMREDVTLRNYSPQPVSCVLRLHLEADFAHLLEVKQGRVQPRGEHRLKFPDGERLLFSCHRDGTVRGAQIDFSEAPASGPRVAAWEVTVAGRDEWGLCLQVTATIDERTVEPRYACGQPVDEAVPNVRLAQWRRHVGRVDTDYAPLATAVARAREDVGSLRIFDPEHPHRTVVAAGAPWFMTVFGRDSLLTAWMALLVDPDLALGVLRTLADFQGQDVDPSTEEEPGRILHEVRFGAAGSLSLGGGRIYYGTVDATPLFVMLLGELQRWGLAQAELRGLRSHADRALAWVREFGDRDGDGYVEYQRAGDTGLDHQGWKDSWDGTRFADGGLAQPPIALCEVQGYVYAAYLARARLADDDGDERTAADCRSAAADLKARFNRDFWLDERGWFALGLDRDKRPIDALTSNMGHCLWTGIVDADKAHAVAQRLRSPELFSGWGIRTLAASMAAFDPVSYHNGSVWPHDTALIAAGLRRYGYVEQAQQVILALLDVAASLGGRLPELFCGFARGEVATPVTYPTSCSPQAWAAAAPLLLVRTLLGFEPWAS
ncbi:MAG: amylo-alpha-1,6-glucosidase, partial [Actinomycetota bacterium]|nr:amylo-alpha-1,6-glucosidase [Actinomycetota bacterium]